MTEMQVEEKVMEMPKGMPKVIPTHTGLVYLAGPITGEGYEECTTWRQYVAERLAPEVEALSPLRNKAFLVGETTIDDSYEHTVVASGRGIYLRDKHDVKRADALLIYFGEAKRPSLGTTMEIGWADAWGKPMVIVDYKFEGHHDHAMIGNADHAIHVDTLDQGIQMVNHILGTGI